jgi:hypothetical protein
MDVIGMPETEGDVLGSDGSGMAESIALPERGRWSHVRGGSKRGLGHRVLTLSRVETASRGDEPRMPVCSRT